MEEKGDRIFAIDFLRVIAILGVILIHSTSKSLGISNDDLVRIPWTFDLDQAARFAVPLFFLLSGASLGVRYQHIESFKSYFKRRVSKIFIPYVVWSLFFYIVIHRDPIKTLFSLDYAKILLLDGSSEYHLYFIPALVFLYLLFPLLLSKLTFLMKKKTILMLSLLQILLLSVNYYFGFDKATLIPEGIRVGILNFYLFFLGIITVRKREVVLGYINKRFFSIVLLTILALIISIYESFQLYYRVNNTYFIGSNWRVALNLYTIGLASILYVVSSHVGKFVKSAVVFMSGLSYFVYFIHVLFISFFWRFLGSYLFYKSNSHVVEQLWFDPFAFVFVSVLSFGSAWIVSKIPKISWILGIK